MKPELLPIPKEGFVITQFLTVSDVKRSAKFYKSVLNAEAAMEGEPTILKVANTWIILNVGGGPTDDKPEITLSPPSDLNSVSSFLNIRVADIQKCYKEWSAAGAEFITEPKNHEREWRCYMKDPDGYIIEVGQMKV